MVVRLQPYTYSMYVREFIMIPGIFLCLYFQECLFNDKWSKLWRKAERPGYPAGRDNITSTLCAVTRLHDSISTFHSLILFVESASTYDVHGLNSRQSFKSYASANAFSFSLLLFSSSSSSLLLLENSSK